MKKVLSSLLAFLMLLIVGCTQVSPESDVSSLPNESKVSEISEQTTTTTTTTVTTAKSTATKKESQVATGAKTSIFAATTNKTKPKFISKDKAKAVAFERAGVKAKDVTRLQIELDYDDDRRIWEYEIDFQVGKMKYEISVNAVIGTITAFEMEFDAD